MFKTWDLLGEIKRVLSGEFVGTVVLATGFVSTETGDLYWPSLQGLTFLASGQEGAGEGRK